MAFATVTVHTGVEETSSNATVTITVPSVATGDRLIVFLSTDGASITFTWPSGGNPAWTELQAEASRTGGPTTEIRYRDITGSEGWSSGGTFDVGLSASEAGTAHVVKVAAGTYHTGTAPAVGTAANGSSTQPNPPSLNPSGWDVEDTVWIAYYACDNSQNTFTSFPTGYDDNQSDIGATSTSAATRQGIATKNNAAASEDPGVFTIGTETWLTNTVAIRPAAAGATTVRAYAQAQAQIKQTYRGHGQAQAQIKTTYRAHGQAQARIKQSYVAHGQAQAQVKQTYRAFGQSQGWIKTTYRAFGQAQAWIETTYNGLGQAQGSIKQTYYASGQSQAQVKQTYFASGQAQALISQTFFASGQAQAQVKTSYTATGQAQGSIKASYVASAQAQAQIKTTYLVHGQSQAWIEATYTASAQAQGWIEQTYSAVGQAQGWVKTSYTATGQAQASILLHRQASGQAQAFIDSPVVSTMGHGQAQAFIFAGLLDLDLSDHRSSVLVLSNGQLNLRAYDVGLILIITEVGE